MRIQIVSIVRQDLPKSMDLSIHSQEKLNEIAIGPPAPC